MCDEIVATESGAVALLSDMGSTMLCWMNEAGVMLRVGYYVATDRPADIIGHSAPRGIVRDSVNRTLIASESERHDRPHQGRIIMVDDAGAVVRARQLDGLRESGISGMLTLSDGRILIYGTESAEEIDYSGVEPKDWRGHMIRMGNGIRSFPTYWIFDPELREVTAYTVHTPYAYTGIRNGRELDDGTIILLTTASLHGVEAIGGIVVHRRTGKTSLLLAGSIDISTVKSVDPIRFAFLDSIIGSNLPAALHFSTDGFGTDASDGLVRFGRGQRSVPFVVVGSVPSTIDCLNQSVDTVSITSRPVDLIDIDITASMIELERSDQEPKELIVDSPLLLLMPVCDDPE
jgi:hypothetical protein